LQAFYSSPLSSFRLTGFNKTDIAGIQKIITFGAPFKKGIKKQKHKI
jgi:hypothetical protein